MASSGEFSSRHGELEQNVHSEFLLEEQRQLEKQSISETQQAVDSLLAILGQEIPSHRDDSVDLDQYVLECKNPSFEDNTEFFKDEPLCFKDETQCFKDETQNFKDEAQDKPKTLDCSDYLNSFEAKYDGVVANLINSKLPRVKEHIEDVKKLKKLSKLKDQQNFKGHGNFEIQEKVQEKGHVDVKVYEKSDRENLKEHDKQVQEKVEVQEKTKDQNKLKSQDPKSQDNTHSKAGFRILSNVILPPNEKFCLPLIRKSLSSNNPKSRGFDVSTYKSSTISPDSPKPKSPNCDFPKQKSFIRDCPSLSVPTITEPTPNSLTAKSLTPNSSESRSNSSTSSTPNSLTQFSALKPSNFPTSSDQPRKESLSKKPPVSIKYQIPKRNSVQQKFKKPVCKQNNRKSFNKENHRKTSEKENDKKAVAHNDKVFGQEQSFSTENVRKSYLEKVEDGNSTKISPGPTKFSKAALEEIKKRRLSNFINISEVENSKTSSGKVKFSKAAVKEIEIISKSRNKSEDVNMGISSDPVNFSKSEKTKRKASHPFAECEQQACKKSRKDFKGKSLYNDKSVSLKSSTVSKTLAKVSKASTKVSKTSAKVSKPSSVFKTLPTISKASPKVSTKYSEVSMDPSGQFKLPRPQAPKVSLQSPQVLSKRKREEDQPSVSEHLNDYKMGKWVKPRPTSFKFESSLKRKVFKTEFLKQHISEQEVFLSISDDFNFTYTQGEPASKRVKMEKTLRVSNASKADACPVTDMIDLEDAISLILDGSLVENKPKESLENVHASVNLAEDLDLSSSEDEAEEHLERPETDKEKSELKATEPKKTPEIRSESLVKDLEVVKSSKKIEKRRESLVIRFVKNPKDNNYKVAFPVIDDVVSSDKTSPIKTDNPSVGKKNSSEKPKRLQTKTEKTEVKSEKTEIKSEKTFDEEPRKLDKLVIRCDNKTYKIEKKSSKCREPAPKTEKGVEE